MVAASGASTELKPWSGKELDEDILQEGEEIGVLQEVQGTGQVNKPSPGTVFYSLSYRIIANFYLNPLAVLGNGPFTKKHKRVKDQLSVNVSILIFVEEKHYLDEYKYLVIATWCLSFVTYRDAYLSYKRNI